MSTWAGRRALKVMAVESLSDEAWDEAVKESGQPYRFSHLAAAGHAFQVAFASHSFEPCRVTYGDGAIALHPLVRVARRLPPLTMALAMPLDLEGTPLVLSGSIGVSHIRALFGELGTGTLVISGGAGGSPPEAGERTDQETHVLGLRGGFEQVWKTSFSDKTRNMCRKAERSGVTVTEESNPAGATAYYELYEKSTQRWGYSTPPYPRGLISSLVTSGSAELWLARREDEPIAGALLLRGSHDLLYWSGAMDREHRQVAPSNAILRTAIESACLRGFDYLDFGASGGMSGVESFKRSFGAEIRTYSTISVSSWSYRQLVRAQREAGRVKAKL